MAGGCRKGAGERGAFDRKLLVRIGFGAALLAALAGLIAFDAVTGAWVGSALLIALALVRAVFELWALLGALVSVPGRSVAVLCALGLVVCGIAGDRFPLAGLDITWLCACLFALATLELRRPPARERLLGLALAGFGFVYLLVPALLIVRLRFERLGDPDAAGAALPSSLGLTLLLYAVLAAKGADMSAYFVGRAIGRRKMIPWISPGKTWAGAFGALLGALLVTFAFEAWTPLGRLFPWPLAALLAILAAVSGLIGDLVESLIKRSTAVKDSARLVPEFGGVLDIIDSILFVGPLTYLAAGAAIWLRG